MIQKMILLKDTQTGLLNIQPSTCMTAWLAGKDHSSEARALLKFLCTKESFSCTENIQTNEQ